MQLDSEISTPHEIARDMAERHLPIEHMSTRAAVPEARAIRDRLLRKLEQIHLPGNALDALINHFGVEKVAGRS